MSSSVKNGHTLWLIPARAGSKGIKGKNIKDFCGKPLVTHAIGQALECALPQDTVFVSTDSVEIKNIAENAGLEIPFLRSDKNSSDTASTYDVIIETLNSFSKIGKDFEKIVLLQPTSPLRTKKDILDVIASWSSDIDMAVSVKEAEANPYYNLFETDAKGFLHVSKGDGKFTRRQDTPKVWQYNGAVYVMSVSSLLSKPINEFKKIIACPMPEDRSVDIDTSLDWMIAENIFKNLISK